MPRKRDTIKIKRASKMTIDDQIFIFLPGETWKLVPDYPGKPTQKEICQCLLPDLKENKII